jgi:hypothetical protein
LMVVAGSVTRIRGVNLFAPFAAVSSRHARERIQGRVNVDGFHRPFVQHFC